MDTLLLTQDGSHTLYSERFQVTYHSKYGAIQEAQTVFIDAALHPKLAQKAHAISILEIGLGTGLNALMTYLECQKHPEIPVFYTAIEAFPVSQEVVETLNFAACFEEQEAEAARFLSLLHGAAWDVPTRIAPNFTLIKQLKTFETIDFADEFDLVYYDAFAPNSQPELWTIPMFEKMYIALRQNGLLTTYCAKGEVKRNLRAVGFQLESLPGPIGKREMTRATKNEA